MTQKQNKKSDLPTFLSTLNKSKTMLSGGSHRCSICNKVDNESIETNLGDYESNLSFTYDPNDPSHHICIDCEEVIEDQRRDYAYMDQDEDEVQN